MHSWKLLSLSLSLSCAALLLCYGSIVNAKTIHSPTLHDSIKTKFERWGNVYGIDPALLEALSYAESGYDPNAFNSKARIYSRGILQITYPTARLFGYRDTRGVLFHTDTNIRYACLLLCELKGRYGKLSEIISAYNFGVATTKNTKYVLRVLRKYAELKSK